MSGANFCFDILTDWEQMYGERQFKDILYEHSRFWGVKGALVFDIRNK